MCTPASRRPFGSRTQCSASSMSLQPGGSMETTGMCLRSLRWATRSSVMRQAGGGRQAITAGENSWWGTSYSCSSTCVSTSLLPSAPRLRTKCPRGKLSAECAGHVSMETNNRQFASASSRRVCIQIRGTRESTGTNCTVALALGVLLLLLFLMFFVLVWVAPEAAAVGWAEDAYWQVDKSSVPAYCLQLRRTIPATRPYMILGASAWPVELLVAD
mmetsp:Transcript_5166/g.8433  ORF Transcript_5166/g.8433 Transcript_5166/m.8433 type:complete len:216 (+) Transcript_5166:120-767(+)